MHNIHKLSCLFALLVLTLTGCATSPMKPSSSAIVQGVKFTIESCGIQNRDFVCQLTILAEERDAKISITKRTSLVDDIGNEYQLSGANLANIELTESALEVRKEIPAGTPVDANLVFSNISIKAKSMKRLNLYGRTMKLPGSTWVNFNATIAK